MAEVSGEADGAVDTSPTVTLHPIVQEPVLCFRHLHPRKLAAGPLPARENAPLTFFIWTVECAGACKPAPAELGAVVVAILSRKAVAWAGGAGTSRSRAGGALALASAHRNGARGPLTVGRRASRSSSGNRRGRALD